MHNVSKSRRWIFISIVVLLVMAWATPVLADYLGPDRTETTYVAYCRYVQKRCAQQDNGQWEWNTVEDWDCSHGDQGCSGGGGACNKANNGARSCERDEGVREETITLDPATIAGTVNCTLVNGWCNGSSVPELALSASEPVSKYAITLIEGTRNGKSFACQPNATSCNIPMLEGDNAFNFWALSSRGDSSLLVKQTVRVDTRPPEVGLSITGTSGHSGWYKSNINVSATASDATSGVVTFEVAVNGGAYENYVPVMFEDGRHTLQFRVVDNAGNVFEPPVQNFNVDTIPPTIDLPKAWRLGKDVDYSVRDEGSGLASVRIVIEDEDEKYAKVTWDRDASGRSYASHVDWNGEFKDKTVAPPGTYQLWVKAQDVAGNERFVMGKIVVPEPNVPLAALPTVDSLATEAALLPPAELMEADPVPVTTEEEIASGVSSEMTQTFLLTTGSAGAAASTTSSGVLWGAAAAAAISAATAYAVETTRKRKEAEAAQAAAARAEVAEDKARRAEHGMTKAEKQEAKAQQSEVHDQKVKDRKEQQSWANPAKEKAKLKWEQERDAAYAQVVLQQWLEKQQQANFVPPDGIPTYAQSVYVHGGPPVRPEDVLSPEQLQFIGQQEQKKEEIKKAEQLASLPGSAEKSSTPQVPMCGPITERRTDPTGELASEYYDPASGIAVGSYAAWDARHMQLNMLDSGNVSVTANTANGTRNLYKDTLGVQQGFEYYGTKYTPANAAQLKYNGLVNGALSGDAWILAGATSLISNGIEYGWGATSVDDFGNRTVLNQNFWTGTAADTVVGVGTGLAAAAIVGGTIVGLTALGVAAAATAPVWLVVGATALVGAAIGYGLSKAGVNDGLQNVFNNLVDTAQSWFD